MADNTAALNRIYGLFGSLSALTKEQLALSDSEEPEDIDAISAKFGRDIVIRNEIDGLRR